MSDKALTPATLELTQRLQTRFPRNLNPRVLRAWNGASTEAISAALVETFGKPPKLPEPNLRLLKPVAPEPANFSLDETFFNKKNGRVKIYGWGTNFETWFRGKTEEAVVPTPLQVYTLTQGAGDADIVAELGGKEAVEAAMADFWAQLVLQGNGEPGNLLVDGRANILYAEDRGEVFRVVGARCYSDGWRFDAYEFPYAYGWNAGGRVLSPRNS
jgi:hypothetical protein